MNMVDKALHLLNLLFHKGQTSMLLSYENILVNEFVFYLRQLAFSQRYINEQFCPKKYRRCDENMFYLLDWIESKQNDDYVSMNIEEDCSISGNVYVFFRQSTCEKIDTWSPLPR